MVYVFLAEGFETIEALAVVDMLRRAKIDNLTVGVTGSRVQSSQGIEVTADITVDEVNYNNLEAVVLPGGMPGTLNLEASKEVQAAIDYAYDNDLLVCAICAAPSILGHKGIMQGREAIAFPGFEKDLDGAVISDKPVVRSGNIITAKGAGVAVDFGLEIVKAIAGAELSEQIRASIQCR
jgi:4-methyl-5(b-hydroxyethyl)-thiazole monophosphate biosynthesis